MQGSFLVVECSRRLHSLDLTTNRTAVPAMATAVLTLLLLKYVRRCSRNKVTVVAVVENDYGKYSINASDLLPRSTLHIFTYRVVSVIQLLVRINGTELSIPHRKYSKEYSTKLLQYRSLLLGTMPSKWKEQQPSRCI